MTDMITKGGIIVASTEMNIPSSPAILYPTTIAPLTALWPSALYAIVTKSNISSSSIQLYSSTNFFLIKETMTYPPPKVKALK